MMQILWVFTEVTSLVFTNNSARLKSSEFKKHLENIGIIQQSAHAHTET